MAPKKSKVSKRSSDQDDPSDPEYIKKRARNNEAVRKSRDKSKKKAEETMKKVQKLKEDNKVLEGKIEEQRKTKRFLKDLFIQQTTSNMKKPTDEQMKLIKEDESADEIPDDESQEESDSDSESSEEEIAIVEPRRKRRK